jgi:hypothetical protein
MQRRTRSSQWTAVLAIALGLGAGASTTSVLASGCSSDPVEGLGGTRPATTSGGGGEGGGGDPNVAHELWAAVEADVVTTCGACHEAGGIADTPFLAAPDRYVSITSWPGIVTKDPAESVILTYPRKGGGHSGTNIDSDELAGLELSARLSEWLAEEAKLLVEDVPEAGPQIDPFAPILGFNAVYLDALGAEFTGMALTFTASELTESTLELRDLEIHPTAKNGVHLVHPLFVVFDSGDVDPDPVDSFSNVDQTFEAGEAGVLGPGTLVLTNWAVGAKMSIAFETIDLVSPEVADAGTEGGPTGGCKDVDAFVANAQARFAQSCSGCHGGQNAQASAAVDMTALNDDPAKACGQIRNRIDTQTPDSSQIFLNTNPGGNAAHPFKFGGDAAAFSDFKAQVSIWVLAEK